MKTNTTFRSAWAMLLALICSYILSQAFRTVAAVLAPPLQTDLGLAPQQLATFAGAFHLAFGASQLFVGMAIDAWGLRRTLLVLFPLAPLGAAVAAGAYGYGQLLVGQVLIGLGCAPTFLACTVFIAQRFTDKQFASVSGAVLGIGSAGLLLTGTPLAWVISIGSWRAALWLMAAAAGAAWLATLVLVEEKRSVSSSSGRPSLGASLRGYGEILRLRHTYGVLLLGCFTYAAFLALRGLWLGPLLLDRHGFSLIQIGNAALLGSVVGILGPPLFGRLDPGKQRRRTWIVCSTLLAALLYLVMAFSSSAALDVAVSTATNLLFGFIVLQFADVRSAYPPQMTGRAMALLNMAMFLGVALMQWMTGLAAAAAPALGLEAYMLVLALIAMLLGLAAVLFKIFPQPASDAATSAAHG